MEPVYWKRPDGGVSATHFAPKAVEAIEWACRNCGVLDQRDAIAARGAALMAEQAALTEKAVGLQRDLSAPMAAKDQVLRNTIERAIVAQQTEAAVHLANMNALLEDVNLLDAVNRVRDTIGLSEDGHADILLARPEYKGWTKITRDEYDKLSVA